MTDTTASVQAAVAATFDPAALDAAVARSHLTAAPADPIEHALQSLDARLSRIECALGLVSPIVENYQKEPYHVRDK
jgi:hypothetical protein